MRNTTFTMDNNTRLTGVSDWNRIQILTEEYRALYALLTFRLGAIDQRLPLAAGALTALLITTPSLPQFQQVLFLWIAPASCVWLHRVVLLHVQSKEDVLRRIAEIEHQINRLASIELIVFQSHHPNQGRVVGGRSGFGSVLAIMINCLLVVAVASTLMAYEFRSNLLVVGAYAFYAFTVSLALIRSTRQLSEYRYRRSPRLDSD